MEEVSTVSQVNMYIKNMFVRDYALRQLRVKGEISNCKYHSSGCRLKNACNYNAYCFANITVSTFNNYPV